MRTLIAAAALAGFAGPALADAVVVYDRDLGETFSAKREIVSLAQEAFGETAVYATGDTLPVGLLETLTPGGTLSAAAEAGDPPDALAGRLPHSEPGTEWKAVGDHLVEVRADDTIAMTVYDVLP